MDTIKQKRIYNQLLEVNILTEDIANPIWLSISEGAKIGGVQTKTIRRAIKDKKIKYKVINNRYILELASLIIYLHTTQKLKNKLIESGIGQYIDKWRD